MTCPKDYVNLSLRARSTREMRLGISIRRVAVSEKRRIWENGIREARKTVEAKAAR